MPHITIENSNNISQESILEFGREIMKMMSKQEGNFDLEQCKFRNFPCDKYFVGSLSQDSSSFFHITIKIMSGRSDAIKKNLAIKAFDLATNFIVQENVKSSIKGRFDISVDIVDMNREFYQKTTIN